MESRSESDREVLYDIQLRSQPPESLRAHYPSMTVRVTGAQTALRRRVSGPGQLDALLQELRSMGLVLRDVHRLPAAGDVAAGRSDSLGSLPATYEVRVSGELGEPLLRYLQCSHYAVPQQTAVRLAVGPEELTRFLRACTECGAIIERVRRVDPAPGVARDRAEDS